MRDLAIEKRGEGREGRIEVRGSEGKRKKFGVRGKISKK